MTRHFLFGSDSYLGFRAVKSHFLPWIRAVGLETFSTDSERQEFTVEIANEVTGDLEVTLQSGSKVVIQSKQWKHHLSTYIQALHSAGGFGGSYMKPLRERFFAHLKGDCACFESPPRLIEPVENSSITGAWKRDL